MASTEFHNRRILVMGLGRFGGGIGVTRWLAEQGARVTVTDRADATDLSAAINKLNGLDVSYHLGGHPLEDLDRADLLVVSPAVDKRTSELFQSAVTRGVPWTSEMNLFLARCPSRVVGITGTAGKSTTCAMVYHVLAAAVEAKDAPCRRAWFGGNIGRSLLSDLPNMAADDVVVLELSSFQLEDVATIRTSPSVAVILNVTPNHLDRHGNLESYFDAKLNIMRFQRDSDVAVIGPDDPELLAAAARISAQTGVRLVPVRAGQPFELRVPGRHNQINAACAAEVCRCLGLSEVLIRRALTEYVGLPHRLQHVRRYRGVDYYNDSKATTPHATSIAVEAFDRPVIAIIGGYEKGLPLDAMARVLVRRAKVVVCCGAAGPRYADAVTDARGAVAVPRVERVDRLARAIDQAQSFAAPGDVVLLSPGCSSYDEFTNYEQRGQAFVDAVNQWSEA